MDHFRGRGGLGRHGAVVAPFKASNPATRHSTPSHMAQGPAPAQARDAHQRIVDPCPLSSCDAPLGCRVSAQGHSWAMPLSRSSELLGSRFGQSVPGLGLTILFKSFDVEARTRCVSRRQPADEVFVAPIQSRELRQNIRAVSQSEERSGLREC